MSAVTRTTRRSTRLKTPVQDQKPKEILRDETLGVKLENIEKTPASASNTSKRHTETSALKISTNKKRKTDGKRKTNSLKKRHNTGASDEESEDADGFESYAGSHVEHSSEFEMIEGLPCSSDLPPDNYQQFFTHPLSIIDSAVLYNALQQSRKTWCHGEMFKKYWSKSRDGSTYHIKLYRDDQDNLLKDSALNESQSLLNNGLNTTNSTNNNGSMHKFTDCIMAAGPHQFKIKLFILKNDELEESWKEKQDEIKKEKEQLREQQKLLKLQEQEAKRQEQEKLKEMKEQEKEEKIKLKKLKQEQKEVEKHERELNKQKQKEERLKKKEEMKVFSLLKKQEDAVRKQKMMEERKRQKEEEKIKKREEKLKAAAKLREEMRSKAQLKKEKDSSTSATKTKSSTDSNKGSTSNASPQPRTMYTSPEEQKMIVNLNRMAKADPKLGTLMKKVAAAYASPEEITLFKIHIEEAKKMDPPPNWEPVDYSKINEATESEKPEQVTPKESKEENQKVNTQNKNELVEQNKHQRPVTTKSEHLNNSTGNIASENGKDVRENQNSDESNKEITESKDKDTAVSSKTHSELPGNTNNYKTNEGIMNNKSNMDKPKDRDGDETEVGEATLKSGASNENASKEHCANSASLESQTKTASQSGAVSEANEKGGDVDKQDPKLESGSSPNQQVNELSKTNLENAKTDGNSARVSSTESNDAVALQVRNVDKTQSSDGATTLQKTDATSKTFMSADDMDKPNLSNVNPENCSDKLEKDASTSNGQELDKTTDEKKQVSISSNDSSNSSGFAQDSKGVQPLQNKILTSKANSVIADIPDQTKQNVRDTEKGASSTGGTFIVKTENTVQKEEEQLSLFQQKYAENADLLIEFNEHTSERFLFPKDCFIDYDFENNVYTISWMILYNAAEFSKYCGKRKIDYDYKNNQYTLFPLEVLEKGPIPLYSSFTMQLSDIPRKFRPIIINSCVQNSQAVKEKMETVIKRGQRLSGYNLWYQIDAYDNEDLGEELRSNIQAYEKSFKYKRASIRR
ncbi:hypothetical protein ACO0RG_003987 [Hanseniaspora osmophila]